MIKKILIILVLWSVSYQTTLAQDFYKDYTNYIKEQYYLHTHKRIKNIRSLNVGVDRIKKLFDTVQMQTGVSMLQADTLYFIEYGGRLGTFEMSLIWNKNHSCQYVYSFEWHGKSLSEHYDVQVNASKLLNSLSPDFRKLVETADTAAYNSYCRLHRPYLDGDAGEFKVAFKTKNHWRFLTSSLAFDGEVETNPDAVPHNTGHQ